MVLRHYREVRSPDQTFPFLVVSHLLPDILVMWLQKIVSVRITCYSDVTTMVKSLLPCQVRLEGKGIVDAPRTIGEMHVIRPLCANGEIIGGIADQTVIKVQTVVLRTQQMFVGLGIEHDVGPEDALHVVGLLAVVIVYVFYTLTVEELAQSLGILFTLLASRTGREYDGGQETAVAGHQLIKVLISP